MITFRPINLEKDYPTLQMWWAVHGVMDVPRMILPRGWMALADEKELAASFLYLEPKLIGVIEWTTSNPQFSFSRLLIEAVKGLYAHLEGEAKTNACSCVISFVKPKSWEERTMAKLGYTTSPDDPGHRLYVKALCQS